MNSRKRLLIVSPRFLFPLDQGGKIRTANILRGLKGGAFETILASPAPPGHARFAEEIAGVCDAFVSWPEPRPSRLRRVAALADRLPVAVATDRSAAGRTAIARAIDGHAPDVVLVDFPHAAVLMPARVPAARVMFTHNVEAEIFERHQRVARGPMRAVWRSQTRKMRAFEGDVLRGFDSVVAVSAKDADNLRQRYGLPRVAVIDTGVDLDFFTFTPPEPAPPGGGTIVFTGSMDWRANIDGVGFLMDGVWPAIAHARPQARALIIGRNPPEALVAAARERKLPWSFTGFVDDIRPYAAQGHVYVIPLRVGSGTRIKAFEAMAMGRPVVSTRVGVEGLSIVPDEHYLAADTAPDFAAAVLRLLDEAPLAARLAGAARALLEERFSWAHVAHQFEAICLEARAAG